MVDCDFVLFFIIVLLKPPFLLRMDIPLFTGQHSMVLGKL